MTNGPITRAEGERLRLLQHLQRLRTIVGQVISDLEKRAPISGPDVAQSLVFTAIDAAQTMSRLDAFDLAERDAAGGKP